MSITDVAKKKSMELRLIHGVAYGHPWFGRWGYRLGRGSFGVTHQMHQRSIEALAGIPLFLVLHHFSSFPDLLSLVAKYQSMCGCALQTLGQLLRFIMELKNTLPPEPPAKSVSTLSSEAGSCRWSYKRVELATRVIVEVLKKADAKWVPRQDVREAARGYIGDTGLLDFVLKSLGNHVVGSYMVRRAVNPVTKVLEYCLEAASLSVPSKNINGSSGLTKSQFHVTRMQLTMDLFYLYKYLLKDFRPGMSSGVLTAIPAAVRMVLDGKHLVKDYQCDLWEPKQSNDRSDLNDDEGGAKLRLMCGVWLRNLHNNEETPIELIPPQELVVLPAHATVGQLKAEVERCFRDLYCYCKSFVAEYVEDVHGGDSDLVCGLVESGSRVVVAGTVAGAAAAAEVYEGGEETSRAVDCVCGATEYDGERMVCCDICEVWQHGRCVQLDGEEDISAPIFICARCETSILVFPSLL